MITKRTLWLSIIVSMIVGGIAGFEIDRYQFQHEDSHFGKTRFISFMTRELGLTPRQQKQLDSIVTFVHPKFQSIRSRFNVEMQKEADSTQQMISTILTPDQQQKLRALNDKMKSDKDNK